MRFTSAYRLGIVVELGHSVSFASCRRELERERQALSSQRAALDKEAEALQHQVAALLEQR